MLDDGVFLEGNLSLFQIKFRNLNNTKQLVYCEVGIP